MIWEYIISCPIEYQSPACVIRDECEVQLTRASRQPSQTKQAQKEGKNEAQKLRNEPKDERQESTQQGRHRGSEQRHHDAQERLYNRPTRQTRSAKVTDHSGRKYTHKRGVSRPRVPTAPEPLVRGPRTPKTVFNSPPTRPATSPTLRRPLPSNLTSTWACGCPTRPDKDVVADWMSEVT